jgi:hypothetical protein
MNAIGNRSMILQQCMNHVTIESEYDVTFVL